MGKIYVGQYFKITLTLETSVDGWTDTKIRVRKPDGVIEDFAATVIDIPTGKIQANIQAADNTKAGQWIRWAVGTTADSKPMIGESSSFAVYKEGT